MDKEKVIEKFGKPYVVTDATFVMGINYRIGAEIAKRFLGHKRVLDACAGAGFVGIALAEAGLDVIAVDISQEHLKLAKENAAIANLGDKIEFILGDVSDPKILAKAAPFDAANLDMDWAVGEDKKLHVTKLNQMVPPADLLFERVIQFTPNISIRLPKELDIAELDKLPAHELEEIWMDGKLRFLYAYFGNLARRIGRSKLEII